MAVSVFVVGAGNRGGNYSRLMADEAVDAEVVGVAEPIEARREAFAKLYNLSPDRVFSSWNDAAAKERMADVAIITTQDSMHEEPAIAFCERGYDILLEKPMAPTVDSCCRIAEAAEKAGVLMAVCHVMRFTHYTIELKKLVDAGTIGEVVSIQHLEPVGAHHYAHSYVRGNWANEARSSFMLLAKSCHDVDWINHIMGGNCTRISSFGSLNHFRAENRPEGASDRCLDCAVADDCVYNAKRFYQDALDAERFNWPINIVTQDDPTQEGVDRALREGPYGRCVYTCDNDVVDHQVVNMEYDGNRSASFTMTGFSTQPDRFTRIFGTRGELTGDGASITIRNFLTEETEVVDTAVADGSILGGHGGGDGGLARAFVSAVAAQDPSLVSSTIDSALESHVLVFAAEKARREGVVVDLAEYRRDVLGAG